MIKTSYLKQMHILVIANILPFEIGGAEVQVRKLTEAWRQQGQNVTVIGNRIPTRIETVENSTLTFQCIHLPTFLTNRLTRTLSYAFSLSWYIFRHQKKYDLIYCRFLQEAALVTSLLKVLRLTSLPLITCPASSGSKGDAQMLKQFLSTKSLIFLLNRGSTRINIISPSIQEELTRIGIDEKKFAHIPNGVTLPLQPVRTSIDSKNRSCIFVGRLTEQKGLSYLLKAMHSLSQKKIFPKLTIIGEGGERAKLEQMTSDLNLNKQVRFYGIIPHEKVYSFLCNHDIFVLPSLYEGHPNALLEAMAVALPAVVTRCGGSEYFIDDTVGRIAEPENADSFALALQQLLELKAEQLHSMGCAARKLVQEKYDIQVTAAAHIKLFQQCI
jgi:glycosyltransferase involved in cell wall biosynthesis